MCLPGGNWEKGEATSKRACLHYYYHLGAQLPDNYTLPSPSFPISPPMFHCFFFFLVLRFKKEVSYDGGRRRRSFSSSGGNYSDCLAPKVPHGINNRRGITETPIM